MPFPNTIVDRLVGGLLALRVADRQLVPTEEDLERFWATVDGTSLSDDPIEYVHRSAEAGLWTNDAGSLHRTIDLATGSRVLDLHLLHGADVNVRWLMGCAFGVSRSGWSLTATQTAVDRADYCHVVAQAFELAGDSVPANHWPLVDSMIPTYWPYLKNREALLVPLPQVSEGLYLGNILAAQKAWRLASNSACVSLCRVGPNDVQGDGFHNMFWLDDVQVREQARDVDTVLGGAIECVLELLAQQQRVLVHCALGRSRSRAVCAGVAKSIGLDHETMLQSLPNDPDDTGAARDLLNLAIEIAR